MKKSSFNYDELISCANGELFGPGNAKLPSPPMLMFDRITEISEKNGAFNKGLMKAELDIKDDLWFFDCHFKEDPVMPVSTVKFTGEVLKNVKMATYIIDMKRILIKGETTVGLANGVLLADGKKIYSADSLKVGLFK